MIFEAVLQVPHGTAAPMRTGSRSAGRAQGFTYLGLMLFMAISGIAMAGAGLMWHTEMKREKERQLLFVGEEFRQAIASYYDNLPQGAGQFPLTLEDLLRDARYPVIKRHLRRVYADPMTGKRDWELIREQGRIMGVRSQSESAPLKTAGFTELQYEFGEAETYRDWKFVYAAGTQEDSESERPSNSQVPVTEPAGSFGKSSPTTDSRTSGQSASATPSQYRNRQEECLAQRMSDIAACSFYCRKSSSNACSLCSTSMLQRYRACLEGGSLPSLSMP